VQAKAAKWLVIAAVLAGCAAKYELAVPRQVGAEDAAALEEAVVMVAELRYAEAAAKLLSLSRRFESLSDNKRTAESLFWLGYCHEKLDRTGEAARLYGRVVNEYSRQPAAGQAAQRLSRIPESDRL
jgi:hypothetical protein